MQYKCQQIAVLHVRYSSVLMVHWQPKLACVHVENHAVEILCGICNSWYFLKGSFACSAKCTWEIVAPRYQSILLQWLDYFVKVTTLFPRQIIISSSDNILPCCCALTLIVSDHLRSAVDKIKNHVHGPSWRTIPSKSYNILLKHAGKARHFCRKWMLIISPNSIF